MAIPIYLDHAASTPPAEEVVDAMLPWLRGSHANPHSEHRHGLRAAAAVEQARAEIGDLIGANAEEIIFTSGATESNNLALRGVLWNRRVSRLLVAPNAAHKSILEVAHTLAEEGVRVEQLPISRQGTVLVEQAKSVLLGCSGINIGLLSVTHGNNELGTLQPIAPIGDLARQFNLLLHLDASQTAGKVSLNVNRDGVDLASFSSHKMYGPAGIGALYVGSGVEDLLRPIMQGGGQEKGLRPGTVPAFLAVGFGTAAKLAGRLMAESSRHLKQLSEQFLAALSQNGVRFELLGDPDTRIPGHMSLYLPGIPAATLLDRVAADISASTGSACSAGELRPSHVLRAIGLDELQASQVIRITLGRSSSSSDICRAAAALTRGVLRQRSITPE